MKTFSNFGPFLPNLSLACRGLNSEPCPALIPSYSYNPNFIWLMSAWKWACERRGDVTCVCAFKNMWNVQYSSWRDELCWSRVFFFSLYKKKSKSNLLSRNLPKWTQSRMQKDEIWRARLYVDFILFNLQDKKNELSTWHRYAACQSIQQNEY